MFNRWIICKYKNISLYEMGSITLRGKTYEIKTRVIQGKTDDPPLLIGKEINKNGEEDIIIQFNITRSEGKRLEELLTKDEEYTSNDTDVMSHALSRAIINAFEENKNLSTEEYDKLYWDLIEDAKKWLRYWQRLRQLQLRVCPVLVS
jgi:hypothetical protein